VSRRIQISIPRGPFLAALAPSRGRLSSMRRSVPQLGTAAIFRLPAALTPWWVLSDMWRIKVLI